MCMPILESQSPTMQSQCGADFIFYFIFSQHRHEHESEWQQPRQHKDLSGLLLVLLMCS